MSLVQRSPADHDRGTGAPDRLTTPDRDPVTDALRQLRLQGAIFLRAEYRDPWSYQSLTGPETAGILRPGTDRVILFHVVADGPCWISVGEGERHWARAGDVIVLPYGDQHTMGGVGDAQAVALESIMQAPPWTRMPVIRHGRDGEQTDIVCGFLHSQDVLFDPVLRVFPPVFVVRPPEGPAAEWVGPNVASALTQAEASPLGPDGVPTRLPELLLTEVLGIHLASAPAIDTGWLAALQDPVLRPALAAIHAAPERHWTVAQLAAASACSRSQVDQRFREMLGRSP